MDQMIIRSAVKDFVANAMADPRRELLKRASREGAARFHVVGGTDADTDAPNETVAVAGGPAS